MSLDPKVIIILFVKNFFGAFYIFPIWFISVSIFEKTWTQGIGRIPQPMIILLLYGAGFVFFTLLILGCYLWSWLTFIKFNYDLAPDGLHIRSGVVIRKHLFIPYTDIESVDLLVNPLVVRFLNLYALQIKTREIKNTEGILRKKHVQVIPGLTSVVARSLKPQLQQYSHVQAVKKSFFDPVSGVYK